MTKQISPDAWLTRPETSAALIAIGHLVNPKKLAHLAAAGEGPPYVVKRRSGIGPARCHYKWSDVLKWSKDYCEGRPSDHVGRAIRARLAA